MSYIMYNIYDKINMTLQAQIFERIENNNLTAFSCYDFLDLSSYSSINKVLERLEDKNILKRVIRGIYYYPKYNEVLKAYNEISIADTAIALSREFGWKIIPSGISALNILGLSTQVPSTYSYISSGPYKTYDIDGNKLIFKHTNKTNLFNYSYITSLLIIALDEKGDKKITSKDISYLKKIISNKNKKLILKETTQLHGWKKDIINKICLGE